jgi:hypothetical protein
MQAPLLKLHFPEISTCYPGTINFVLEIALQVRLPDTMTPPLAWHPSNPKGERFGITKIGLILPTAKNTMPGSSRQRDRLTGSMTI